MRKLQVAEFLTLDGIMEAPEKWNGPFMNEEIGADIGGNLSQTGALLYGRRTYEEMAAAWPSRDGGMADFFNNAPSTWSRKLWLRLSGTIRRFSRGISWKKYPNSNRGTVRTS